MATPKVDLRRLEDELLARVAARENFADWIKYRGIHTPAKHHDLIIRELQALERGDIRRLMLLFPPGSAKSTYASMEFPPWYIGRNHGKSIISASHTDTLAEKFGRRARNVVADPKFKLVFEDELSPDQTAAGQWETLRKSEYYAAGVGGAITGRRADLGLIDDPVKSKEAAESERERQKAWDWYENDFETRLKPDARQVLIMTRWHEDDLGGRILQRDGDLWRVIRVPMECDSGDDPLGRALGERLWPEWFTDEMVAQAKKNPRVWNSLYQGNPIPEDGNFFKKDWFIEYKPEDLPTTLYYYMASDCAVTDAKDGKDPDFTEVCVYGVDFEGDIWIVDWYYGRVESDVWIDKWCDFILQYHPLTVFAETGQIRRATEPALKKRMEQRKAYCHVEYLPTIHNKAVAATGAKGMASAGKFKIPKFKPWMSHVMAQWLQFPAGRHDDAVDVLSLIARGLDFTMSAGQPRKQASHRMSGRSSDSAWMG
jgi:predicted phage terminase large subunit-like protein